MEIIFWKSEERWQEELEKAEQKLSEQRYDLQQAQYKMGTMKEIFTLQERNRISREIHDSVGHSLSTIIIQARGDFATGQATKFTDSRNERGASWFCGRRIARSA